MADLFNEWPSIRPLVSSAQLERATAMVARGSLRSIEQTKDGYDGVFFDDTSFPYVVSLQIRDGQVYGKCNCLSSSPAEPLCDHVVALYLAASPDKDKIPRPGDNRIILPAPGESLADARQREIKRRRERARSDIAKVELLAASDSSGQYTVTSLSDQHYNVIIRDRELPVNDCNCPDLEINQLGTCKHIEAALLSNQDHHFQTSQPILYCDYSRGIPVLTLQPGKTPDCCPPELLTLFSSEEPFTLKELSADSWQSLNSFHKSGQLIINSCARYLLETFQKNCEASDNVSALIGKIRKQQIPGFKGQLSPSQQEALTFILTKTAAMVTAPFGWGKSLIAIAAIGALSTLNPQFKALIITIDPLMIDWQKQVTEWLKVPVTIFNDSAPLPSGGVLICSYDQAVRLSGKLADFKTDFLIIDEAQYINNWRSTTGNALRLYEAGRRLVLTSCDLLSDPDALFSIMQLVNQHILGPLWLFNQRYISFNEQGQPTFSNPDNILSQLVEYWWRRPLLSSSPNMSLHLSRCYSRPEAAFLENYRQLINQLGSSSLPTKIHNLLDEATRALYFGASTRSASTLAPKVSQLIQLWRGLFSRTNRHYTIITHNEQLLNLASMACNHLECRYYTLFNNSTTTAISSKLTDFYNSTPATMLFCPDSMLKYLRQDDPRQSFIFFDIPWHPLVLKNRLDFVGCNPVLALVYEQTCEEIMLNFYEANKEYYRTLTNQTETNELPLNGPLANFWQQFTAAGTGKTAKNKKSNHKNTNRMSDLFGEETEEVQEPLNRTQPEKTAAEKEADKALAQAATPEPEIIGQPAVIPPQYYPEAMRQLSDMLAKIAAGETVPAKNIKQFKELLLKIGIKV